MARKKRTLLQFLREEPVIAYRLAGALLSGLVVEFALPISEEMQDLVLLVIGLVLVGPGALETWLQRRSVSPTATLERLAGEGPQVNPELLRGRGR